MEKITEIKRRGLSGIYIFEKFDSDEKRQPTCFEDCTEETQNKWIDGLEPEAVKRLAKHLGKRLRNIGDQFDIMT